MECELKPLLRKTLCCNSLPLLHVLSVLSTSLMILTRTLGGSVGFQQVTWLNPSLDQIKRPDWSEPWTGFGSTIQACLVNFSPTLPRKTLVSFATRDHFTIKLVLLEILRVTIQYKWGPGERLQPMRYQRTRNQLTMTIWQLLCLRGFWCLRM